MSELNVKVGDKVILKSGSYSYRNEEIAKVTKVTPSGRIRVDKSTFQFNKYGHEMGKRERWSYGYTIEKATEESIKRIEERQVCNCALKFMHDCKKISFNKAKKIISIMNGESNE